MLCTRSDDEDAPVTERLERPLFGMHRFAWSDGVVEFHLPHGAMIRVLRESGFEVEDLVEVEIPEGATTRYPFVTAEWARRWPAEEVWKARKRRGTRREAGGGRRQVGRSEPGVWAAVIRSEQGWNARFGTLEEAIISCARSRSI